MNESVTAQRPQAATTGINIYYGVERYIVSLANIVMCV